MKKNQVTFALHSQKIEFATLHEVQLAVAFVLPSQ